MNGNSPVRPQLSACVCKRRWALTAPPTLPTNSCACARETKNASCACARETKNACSGEASLRVRTWAKKRVRRWGPDQEDGLEGRQGSFKEDGPVGRPGLHKEHGPGGGQDSLQEDARDHPSWRRICIFKILRMAPQGDKQKKVLRQGRLEEAGRMERAKSKNAIREEVEFWGVRDKVCGRCSRWWKTDKIGWSLFHMEGRTCRPYKSGQATDPSTWEIGLFFWNPSCQTVQQSLKLWNMVETLLEGASGLVWGWYEAITVGKIFTFHGNSSSAQRQEVDAIGAASGIDACQGHSIYGKRRDDFRQEDNSFCNFGASGRTPSR